MPRFAALALARVVALQTADADRGKVSFHRQAAWSYRPALLRPADAEMGERVVSDVIVAECVLRCSSPRRGCGIPVDDPCLLAMQGALLTAQNQRMTGA
jgi:hypothetical protein